MDIFIGTSGWSYDDWKQRFYAGVPRRRWLAHYAQHFDAVEVNATFYGSLKARTLQHWCEQTPAQFRFCIKASRFLTHIGRLDFSAGALTRKRKQADALGSRLAVVLWQLPENLKRDDEPLEHFARRIDRWRKVHHVIEFRNAGWFHADVAARLADHRLAIVRSHSPEWPMWDRTTANLVYVRLHGGQRLYESAYALSTLRHWAARIRGWHSAGREVHVYFDNTASEHAIRNALKLRKLLGLARNPGTPRQATSSNAVKGAKK